MIRELLSVLSFLVQLQNLSSGAPSEKLLQKISHRPKEISFIKFVHSTDLEKLLSSQSLQNTMVFYKRLMELKTQKKTTKASSWLMMKLNSPPKPEDAQDYRPTRQNKICSALKTASLGPNEATSRLSTNSKYFLHCRLMRIYNLTRMN